MRLQPGAPDMLQVVLNLAREGTTKPVGRVRSKEPIFVQLRADLQNPVTPVSRYCRVGVTVWYAVDGYPRVDEAIDLNREVCERLLQADDPHILYAEWQSGPAITQDPLTSEPISYSTLLLEVT